jgi:hypothetical protein
MGHTVIRNTILTSLLVVGLVLSASAQEEMPTQEHFEKTIGKPNYSPYAGREYPTRVLWGDTHLQLARRAVSWDPRTPTASRAAKR